MSAHTILLNGRFHTVDRTQPLASAVAIADGTFLAVGDVEDVMRHRGPATQLIDLAGRTVIPGLNDSHLHLIRGGLNYNLELRWEGVPSLADALRLLKEQALRTPNPRARPEAAAGMASQFHAPVHARTEPARHHQRHRRGRRLPELSRGLRRRR